MFKIWIKTTMDEKLTFSDIFHYEGKFDENKFDEYVRFACTEMDIPAPIVLKTHISNFVKFNICRFNKSDFVESTGFDELTFESCPN